MKNKLKGSMLIVVSIVLILLGLYLITSQYQEYSILVFVLSFVSFIVGLNYTLKSSNPEKQYESTVKQIINTFDSVLVKSNTTPEFKDRSIIIVESMDDLIDAQLEIRKPICYLKQTESCSFALLDDKEAYVYIEKLNDSVKSPVEIEIDNLKNKNKSKDEMDSEMLRDIEKTTIIKLSNKKSYRVSPVRKEKKREIEILDF